MATLCAFKLALFISFFCLSVSGTEQLQPVDECQKLCHDRTGDMFRADTCARGCRFYAIASFIKSKDGDSEPSSTKLLAMCKSSCSEAYNNELLKDCNNGCAEQNVIYSRTESMMEEAKESQSVIESLGVPVMQVKKVMAKVIDNLQIIQTQVLTYFMKDNKLVAVESPTVVTLNGFVKNDGAPKPLLPEELFESESAEHDNIVSSNDLLSSSSSADAVSRVSLDARRYSYLMHLMLMLAAVSVVLLGLSYCFALARHQQRKTLKAANLNLALQQEPLKLVRPEDLTKLSLMEEEEAPPLPKKQDLALTHASV